MDDLIGYEGIYKINRKGEVWSCRQKRNLKLSNIGRYYGLTLIKDKVRKHDTIHRILALQYIPNPENLPEIDHIDRNCYNNDLSNLRWVNRYDNLKNRSTYNVSGSITKTKCNTYNAHYRGKSKIMKDKSECEKWIEEQKLHYEKSLS